MAGNGGKLLASRPTSRDEAGVHGALRQEEALGDEVRGGRGVSLRRNERPDYWRGLVRVARCQRLLVECARDPARAC